MTRPRSRCVGLAAAAALAAAAPTAWADGAPSLSRAQSAYVESCGGCHGLQGISANELVPQLRDRAGFFLCSPASRAYVVRLPNVAFAARSDQDLADLLNFMAFGLGGVSAPKKARAPFTAAEVGTLRRERAGYRSVRTERRVVVKDLAANCGAPLNMTTPAPGY